MRLAGAFVSGFLMPTLVRRLALLCAVLAVIMLPACGSDDADAANAPGAGGPGTVARIEISPPGALLAAGAAERSFHAQAFDADGRPVAAAFTWSSNAPAVVSVASEASDSARAKALQPVGSALVTAEAGGVKASVFAIAAEVAPGAVLVDDAQIVGLPTAVDAAAKLGVGFRYKVDVVSGVTAPVGAILLSTGGKSVAGRVVAVDGSSITVEQVTLKQALPKLSIEQKLDLTQAASLPTELAPKSWSPRPFGTIRPLVEKEFKIGAIECKAEGSIGAVELKKQDFKLEPLKDLTYELSWNDTAKAIVVTGRPQVTFELEPVVKGQLQGKVTCKAILREFIIPLPGPLGIFLGAAIPVGVGVELGATAVITEAGVNLKGTAAADLAIGFRCDGNGENCMSANRITASGDVKPTWLPPTFGLDDFHFEPEAQAFAFAELEGGARFTSTLRFDAIAAQAGFKLTGSLGSEETQAKLADYSSSYKLSFEASAGPAGAVETFLNLLEVALSFVQFEKSIPIADSPVGVDLSASPTAFKTGDMVKFHVGLDPKKLELPVLGYIVDSVRVYRKDVRPDASVSLVLANELLAVPGQKDFDIPWVATLDGTVDKSFVAFVKTKVMDLRLEAGTFVSSGISGGITTPTGVTLPASDGYSFLVPPNEPDFNPTALPLAVGKMWFSQVASGVLTCSAQKRKASKAYIELAFAKETALAPGTYTYVPTTAQLASGQFTGLVTSLGSGCAETSADFISGTLVLTQATSTSFAGNVTLQASNGNATGTFSIPACEKTLAEHKALSFLCESP